MWKRQPFVQPKKRPRQQHQQRKRWHQPAEPPEDQRPPWVSRFCRKWPAGSVGKAMEKMAKETGVI